MANVTIVFGAVLLALGVLSYVGTGADSPTALIPAAFGLVLLILGAAARDSARRKTMMHIAVVVGLLGFLGAASGIPKVLRLLSGESLPRANAVVAQTIMALVCLTFVVMCVKSFMDARRARTSA